MTKTSNNANLAGGRAKTAVIAKQASISPQVINEMLKPERKTRHGN